MYIGGMAGTGKSQVLNILKTFFKEINKSYEFIVVAPTGSAAALLGGSTYHSLFGISDYNEKGLTNLAQVRSRLIGVDYIFFG